MDFYDENFLEVLQSNTKQRESLGKLPFDIILDDDKNYLNDELLLFMGDHSKIKKIINIDGKTEFAMKIIKLNKIQKTDHQRYFDLIHNEIKFLKGLNHPNIIGMRDFFKDKKYFYIIYELAEYGNLLNYYRKTENFTEADVFQMFFQILLAVDMLHRNKIIHRNIKLQNVMLDIHNNLKLANFKYACEENNITQLDKEFLEDNINYCPPEVILSQPYNKKFDIWGLGIVLYELLSKTSPFNGIIIEHTIHNILNANTVIKGKLSDSLKRLLTQLLSKNPQERPSTEEILNNEWITENIQRYDVSFLTHPAFKSSHNLGNLIRFTQNALSPSLNHTVDIRKITFFNKETTQHQMFLNKFSEDESKKYPNIFHDGHFQKSLNQNSLNKSTGNIKKSTNFRFSQSPNETMKKIFAPMKEPFKNHNLEDDDDYIVIQQIKERYSLGNQEEQRFSHPVIIEKKKRNELKNDNNQPYSVGPIDHNRDSEFNKGYNFTVNKNNYVINESIKKNDIRTSDFNEKNLDKNNNYSSHSESIHSNKNNGMRPDHNNSNNSNIREKINLNLNDSKSRFFTKKDESNNNNMLDVTGKSGYSSKSNNKGLFFDRDFSDKNIYI